MMRLPVAIALLSAGLSAPAMATEWTVVTRNAESVELVDIDSIKRTGNTVRFWSRISYFAPVTLSAGTQYDQNDAVIRGDCAEDTTETLQTTGLLKGKVTVQTFAPNQGVKYVTPGSNGAYTLAYVCKISAGSGN